MRSEKLSTSTQEVSATGNYQKISWKCQKIWQQRRELVKAGGRRMFVVIEAIKVNAK